MRKAALIAGIAVALFWSGSVLAAGYDTPILYTAKHIGAGGTAIADVDDPSAMFHNPAGLGRTPFASVMGDFSLLLGEIQGTPNEAQDAISIKSNLTFAPFFLVGGSIKATDWLTFGLAVYPVASAGATYEYTNPTTDDPWEDTTRLVFFEISPGVAFTLPYNIHIGAGYRVSIVTLDRIQGPKSKADGNKTLDFSASGANFLGFRVGAQWDPIDELSIGVVYRHKTVTKVTADKGVAIALPGHDLETEFILPSKLGFGVKGDIGPVTLKTDVEYNFQSQNQESVISGVGEIRDPNTGEVVNEIELSAPNIFAWENNVTARFGAIYNFLDGDLPVRIGYIFDSQATSKNYPSAFGTPPGATHVGTAGVGYGMGSWEANFAYAFRISQGTVTEEDIDAQSDLDGPCRLCGGRGDYKLTMHGLYLDFTYSFE